MEDSVVRVSDRFSAEVRARFGLLPNFFCTASSAPGLIEELWGFAKSAYLDSPLPSLFKERLFVQLSRFCEMRYCIVRHVGFLVGEGRPAGDVSIRPQTIEQAIALLRRPVPDSKCLDRSLAQLERLKSPIAIPESESVLEAALFDALTLLFISPRGADRARLAVINAVGEKTFEILVAFLAFVRTAHYWTETHPALAYEADMVTLMKSQPELAGLMLARADADWAHSAATLRRALEELRSTSGALRSSQERYQALVMATSDMLYRMSPDWTEMWELDGRGFLADTVGADKNWMHRYIPLDEQETVIAAILEAVKSKSPFELEHRVVRLDTTLGWVLSRAVPIIEDGVVTEWFGAAIDLTGRKIAEDALREGDRRKNEFLATLAHELRNPLAPLRNGLQIARLHGPADAALARTFAMMERQVNLLVHLVDDLLDVSRITSGKFTLRRENVKLREVLAGSAEAAQTLIDAHAHLLLIGPCDDEFTVYGDFDRLSQVFSNIFSNAARYTEDAGKIEVRVRREHDNAVVTVADTGIGIPASALSGIFGMFVQVHSHQGHASGGLGIGLSLVRQLVEMHGGSVAVSSPGVNKGTTFTVRLPLALGAADTPSTGAAAASESAAVRARRILVIDDNLDAASSLAAILSVWGFEVITAANGPDGLGRAATFRPHVVFLDLGMPKMNGFEVAIGLRALAGGDELILIALTGWGQAEDIRRTRESGFDHHLLKPVDPSSLRELLAYAE